MKENPTILEAQNLSIGYGSNVISKDINFSLKKGEIVGLVGANGIGKSTLLRTITSMQPRISGDIFLKSQELSEFSSFQISLEMSVVLTEPPASKNLTVSEMVSLGRQPHTNWFGKLSQEDKEKIQTALELTETEELENKRCYELSDGQMQKVAIARAIAQDTPIIILDEPTTHLDIYHRAYLLKLLVKLAEEKKKTILFSTHEVDLAIQMTHKMIVMKKDETLFGTPSELIKNKSFDSLFPSGTIKFDPDSGKFIIP